MKRLDKLVLGELAGPWAFGVAIFTVLIMAGTYLFKMTDYVVQGIPVLTIMKLSFLLLPGVMVGLDYFVADTVTIGARGFFDLFIELNVDPRPAVGGGIAAAAYF